MSRFNTRCLIDQCPLVLFKVKNMIKIGFLTLFLETQREEKPTSAKVRHSAQTTICPSLCFAASVFI
eukprot:m.246526 g.246526  ORF g.246526 m.246526 type:complete len:67 (-) comp70704_c0_seq1:27-227(-)